MRGWGFFRYSRRSPDQRTLLLWQNSRLLQPEQRVPSSLEAQEASTLVSRSSRRTEVTSATSGLSLLASSLSTSLSPRHLLMLCVVKGDAHAGCKELSQELHCWGAQSRTRLWPSGGAREGKREGGAWPLGRPVHQHQPVPAGRGAVPRQVSQPPSGAPSPHWEDWVTTSRPEEQHRSTPGRLALDPGYGLRVDAAPASLPTCC